MSNNYKSYLTVALLVFSFSISLSQKKPITFLTKAELEQAEKAPKEWRKYPWDLKKFILEKFMSPKPDEIELIQKATPEGTKKLAKKKIKALVFYRSYGFPHSSILYGNKALEEMAKKTNCFDATFTDKGEDLTIENMSKYDVIIHNNTTAMERSTTDYYKILNTYLENGGGAVFIHAASDGFKNCPHEELPTGGVFAGHPWGAGGTWAFQLESPDHTLNRGFESNGFYYRDEIYMYKKGSFSKKRSRVLISLEFENEVNKITKQRDLDKMGDMSYNPVSWIHPVGKGRVYNNNFGHSNHTYWNPQIMKHLFDGILYAGGKIDVDDTPSAEISNTKIAPSVK